MHRYFMTLRLFDDPESRTAIALSSQARATHRPRSVRPFGSDSARRPATGDEASETVPPSRFWHYLERHLTIVFVQIYGFRKELAKSASQFVVTSKEHGR